MGMIKKDIKAKIRPRDDVGNDAEVGGSGNDDHEPAHTYASISAEHKAKKRWAAIKDNHFIVGCS